MALSSWSNSSSQGTIQPQSLVNCVLENALVYIAMAAALRHSCTRRKAYVKDFPMPLRSLNTFTQSGLLFRMFPTNGPTLCILPL